MSNYHLPCFIFFSYYLLYIFFNSSTIISFLNRPRHLNFKFLRIRKQWPSVRHIKLFIKMSCNNPLISQFILRPDKHDEISSFFPPVIFSDWNSAIFYVMFRMNILPASSCLKHKFNKFDKVNKTAHKNLECHILEEHKCKVKLLA